MSRLFTLHASAADTADHFGVTDGAQIAVPSEMVEGDSGPVVFDGGNRRMMKTVSWGFPRPSRASRAWGGEAGIIGLVADLTNPMWDTLVVEPRYRCLIPLTHFANPAGDAGAKTRTWFSIKDQPITAWAGFWRNLPDRGPVFGGMTMTANDAVMPYNDRMPVLLAPHEYEQWLHCPIQDVIAFQFRAPIAADRMVIMHTDDRWRSGKLPDFTVEAQIGLL